MLQQVAQLGGGGLRRGLATTFAFALAAQQLVKLRRHQLAVRVQVVQKRAAVTVSQGVRNPGQVIVTGWQGVGLLVVQVLNAVLDMAQKSVGVNQPRCGVIKHQASMRQTPQRVDRAAGTQLGELPAAHHLQQLHGKFNLPNAAARHLHVVSALRPPSAALGGVVANLPMQNAQRVKHAVVQIAPEYKRQHNAAQRHR